MSDAVITAVIVAVSSIVCQLLINRNNRVKRSKEETDKEKERAVALALKDQKLEERMARIEEKLDIHNGYAEILSKIGTDIAVIKTELKNLKGA